MKIKEENQSKKGFKKWIALGLSFLILFVSTNAYSAKVQIALLLDTSNSMDGLINQAKSQLWKMVNELALARQDGEIPEIEIALYEYGKSSLPASEGFIRQLTPFTTDLDKVSEDLFGLATNGGNEYCGQVIQTSVDQLAWSNENSDLKIIFIAGNEPFTQGAVPYKNACSNAISNGIMVNTIFCGNYDEGVRTKWKDGADVADGKYMNIDHNQQVAHIAAPQDAAINALNRELNATYIAYGHTGKKMKRRMETQDANSAGYGTAAAAERAVTKSSEAYKAADWDLVDAVAEDAEVLEKEEALPEEMKGMTEDERKRYVKEKQEKRAEIQQQIQKLNDERKKHIAKKQREMADNNTLDQVIIKTVREQAISKNYVFE